MNVAPLPLPDRVSSHNRVKTYGSMVHILFQLLVGRYPCQRSWPQGKSLRPYVEGWVQQLSRKASLDGREGNVQVIEKTPSLIKNFPEEPFSRASSLVLAFSHRFALTVGFGVVAAANPIWNQSTIHSRVAHSGCMTATTDQQCCAPSASAVTCIACDRPCFWPH